MIYEFDGKRPKIDPTAFVSSSAVIIGDVSIGPRCYIGPGAVIRGDSKPIVIGSESAIEDLVLIHVGGSKSKGCFIGNRVTVGHAAIVHCNRICDGANIGMGAVLSLFSEIGEYAVVAEGAVVRNSQIVPPRVVAGGIPALVLRELEPKDIRAWEISKQTYIDLAEKCNTPGVLKRLD